MSLCINPQCSSPSNSADTLFCKSCGSELLLEGRYQAIKQLGQGGFGKTFEVQDVHSNEPRVLKILIDNQPKAVELFQREADTLKMLDHPGIPKVEEDDYFVYFSRDTQQPLHCLVMEKIEGMDLYEYIRSKQFRPIKEKLAIQWLKEIVNILQLVHDNNFFHRDIKPPNIMLRASGKLVLIDFGAAREETKTYYFAQQQGRVTGISSPGYTPNEQMNFQAVPQSDFFALGRTFVFLLTGKEPLDPAIYNSYNDEMHWRDSVPNISPKFADLIDRMMERLPSQRPADTREILQCLTDIEQAQISQPSPQLNIGYQSTPQVYKQSFQSIQSTPPPNLSNQTNPQPIIGFWGQWIMTSICTTFLIAVFAVESPVENIGYLLIVGIILLAIVQWSVLRIFAPWVSNTSWWILVTVLGYILGLFAGVIPAGILVSILDNSNLDPSMIGAVGGFVVVVGGFTVLGTIQWLLLRRWVYQAYQWIWANTLSSLAILTIGILNDGSSNSTNKGLIALWFVISFSIFNAITGKVLARLLKNPI